MRLLVLILLIPGLAGAQGIECPSCVIGVYDDPELSRNYGFWDASTSAVKTLWVGIVYDPDFPFKGLTGVEFSIDGTARFGCGSGEPCYSYGGLVDPVVTIGHTIASPEEKENGTGGVNIAWSSCLRDNRPFVKIALGGHDSVPNNLVLRVIRKFPPSSPSLPHPSFTRCEMVFAPVTVTGGCYVINPTVGPGEMVDDCRLTETTSVDSGTWSMIKALYR